MKALYRINLQYLLNQKRNETINSLLMFRVAVCQPVNQIINYKLYHPQHHHHQPPPPPRPPPPPHIIV